MTSRSVLRLILPATTLLVPALPAAAQSNVEGRVARLEGEMRAVQRKVFPAGAAGGLQPDIVAAAPPVDGPGSPASSAIVDLTQRVTSLEQQMATLTGQTEQNGYQLRVLREQFEAYKRSTDARLAAAATAPAPSPIAGALEESDVPAARPAPTRPAPAAERPATTPARAPTAAIDRPATGDPAEDSYLVGYRLWEAKRYPEAQAALKKTVADYPKSRRASYAQNLLGRAYLDDGKPSLASMAFYDNYKKMPDGERAPDSLLYLGQALQRLNKPADACKVYDELTDVYAGKLSATMQADVAKGRTAAKCK
ncbi:YbgF trimerization domain-containing protein [Sphingomonas rubra]|uniref:TolA-binding protein n=1 Tax=Sphingomonas rubra TaxID=634430 RepID=A0A1I5U6N5_9SPHN|nr:YbgF trimerization domain-containing protein [Sphingomonas rubra]SFP90914.1 TolA-binding protein [Sphingomonas rubra]